MTTKASYTLMLYSDVVAEPTAGLNLIQNILYKVILKKQKIEGGRHFCFIQIRYSQILQVTEI